MRNECLVDVQKVTDIDLLKLASLEEMKAAADNYDMVKRLEEILMVWHAQIDKVRLCVLFVWSITDKTPQMKIYSLKNSTEASISLSSTRC